MGAIHGPVKPSSMNRCSIKRTNMFDVTVKTIIDVMNDLTSR